MEGKTRDGRMARTLVRSPECRMVKRQSTRFLNRVRKFDSCRGHSPEIDLEAGLALLTA